MKEVYTLTIKERIEAVKKQDKIISEDTTVLEEKWFKVNSFVSGGK